MEQKIEHLARALYRTQDGAREWEKEPELLRSQFRMHAHDAISLFGLGQERKRLEALRSTIVRLSEHPHGEAATSSPHTLSQPSMLGDAVHSCQLSERTAVP